MVFMRNEFMHHAERVGDDQKQAQGSLFRKYQKCMDLI